jgi:hypothetical protein
MSVVITAFVAGVAHVLAGPDHLAAVSPFSVSGASKAWKVGFRWGIGHALGTLVLGLVALLARDLVPVELLSAWGERLVGVVLIAVGVFAIRGLLRTRVHTHAHTHEGVTHAHIHAHVAGDLDHTHDQRAGQRHVHDHSPTSIGALHGLAGGSHLLGALPALGLASALEAGSYLAAFAVGAVAAMTAWTAGLGAAAGRLSIVSEGAASAFRWAFALAAIGIGIAWLVWSL